MMAIVEICCMLCIQLKELGWLKGHEVHIILEDGTLIFRQCPYKLNGMKRALDQVWTMELFDVRLVELSRMF